MNEKTRNITTAALMAAAVFVVTRFIQIPIPLGYFNVGNAVILLFCLVVRSPWGIAASGIGSGLADLVSYPVYTVPTLIIKAIMPALYYLIRGKLGDRKFAPVIAVAVSTLIPLFGYTITGGILYGGFAAGLAQFPGLLVEYAANLVIFAILHKPVEAASKQIYRAA